MCAARCGLAHLRLMSRRLVKCHSRCVLSKALQACARLSIGKRLTCLAISSLWTILRFARTVCLGRDCTRELRAMNSILLPSPFAPPGTRSFVPKRCDNMSFHSDLRSSGSLAIQRVVYGLPSLVSGPGMTSEDDGELFKEKGG